MSERVTAYIGLGSNMGNRRQNIERAIQLLSECGQIDITGTSSLIETEPEGGPEQGKFLNGALEIETTLGPFDLLGLLQEIEACLGRERGLRWGPRTIDLDILLYGEEIIERENLRIPHPRMHLRRFVLEPLLEIAPHARHPVLKENIRSLSVAKDPNGVDSTSDPAAE